MMMQKDNFNRLFSMYRENDQIGLVLGAGVSRESGVPLYKELAINVLDMARKTRKKKKVSLKALEFLKTKSLSANKDPDKIL
jgi:NAD-dependent SIR2 family protein deacetylase